MPKEIDLPEDTPIPRAVRSEQYPPTSIRDKSPNSWRKSIRAVANEGKPKSKVQYIVAVTALVTAFGGGTGVSAFVSAFTGSKETNEKLDDLGKKVDSLAAKVQSDSDSKAAKDRRQDARDDLLAKAVYKLNNGSPALDWPKPDPDSWTTSVDGLTYRTQRSWPTEPTE